jgi:hypothetical protein
VTLVHAQAGCISSHAVARLCNAALASARTMPHTSPVTNGVASIDCTHCAMPATAHARALLHTRLLRRWGWRASARRQHRWWR